MRWQRRLLLHLQRGRQLPRAAGLPPLMDVVAVVAIMVHGALADVVPRTAW